MAYTKRVRGDHTSADENYSHNNITIFSDGAGKIFLCAVLVLFALLLLYLWFMQNMVFVGLIYCVFFVALCCTALYIWRFLSDTVTQQQINKARAQWAATVHAPTDHLIAVKHPVTQEITVHNAQQVTVQQNMPAPLQQFEEYQQLHVPQLSDLYDGGRDDNE